MNIPNKLTVMRVILIPVFAAVMFTEEIPYRFLIAAVIFIISSITDALDGHIARKRDMITDFGKLMDPLADKVSVTTALLFIVNMTEDKTWRMVLTIAVIVVIAREFLVTSLRLLAVNKDGAVIAASIFGKIKTVFQMTSIAIILIEQQFSAKLTELLGFSHWLGYILLGIAVIATVISSIQYLNSYKRYIDPKK